MNMRNIKLKNTLAAVFLTALVMFLVFNLAPRNNAEADDNPANAPYTVVEEDSDWGEISSNPEVTYNALSWQAGDLIVVVGGAEAGNNGLNTPTATGLTFSLVSSAATGDINNSPVYVWAATATSDGSSFITSTHTTVPLSSMAGIHAFVYRNSSGVGNVNTMVGQNALTLSLNRGFSNSAVVEIFGDWNAGSDLTVDPTPAGGYVYPLNMSGRATFFINNWEDQSVPGTTSYGITNFTGTPKMSGVVVEIKGITGPAGHRVNIRGGGGASGPSAITRIGSVGAILGGNINTGSTSITVPAGTTLIVVGTSGYVNYNNYYGTGTLTIAGQSLTMARADRDTPADADKSAVWYIASASLPTGSQTLAWNWGGSSNMADGGQIVYAFYSGVNVANPVKDTGGNYIEGSLANSTISTASMSAASGDMIWSNAYLFNTSMPTGETWTNATSIYGVTNNGSRAAAAERFPSGNTSVSLNDDGGTGTANLYMTLSSVVFRAGSTGATVPVKIRGGGDAGVTSSIAYVNSAAGTDSLGTGVTTRTVTITPSAAGHLLVATVDYQGQFVTATVSDNVNGSWGPPAVGPTNWNIDSTLNMYTFYSFSSNTSPLTITATFSGTAYYAYINVAEFSGVSLISPLDGTPNSNAADSTSGTDNMNSGPITTTTDGDLIFGFSDFYFGPSGTPGTGYTSVVGTGIPEYLIQTTHGSITPTFTSSHGAGDHYGAQVTAFKPATISGVSGGNVKFR